MTDNSNPRSSIEARLATVSEHNFADFVAQAPASMLFFCGDPSRFPESLDVATILPLLVAEFAPRLQAAIVSASAERLLQQKYGFSSWPSLVFVTPDGYLDTISRVQDWHSYLTRISAILELPPGRAPGIGIPVVTS